MAVIDSPDMVIMKRAAEKAARSLIRDFGEVENLQVSRKGPGDFVSAADKRSEEIIYEELKKARPNYSYLMEESGSVEGSDKDHMWIIDPLDGTTNFLHGLPHWAISIALQSKGEIVCGLIYDPVKDDLFTAEKSKGAFHNRRKRLRVSGRNKFEFSAIMAGGPDNSDSKKFFDEYIAVQKLGPAIRRNGAAALDLAYVAAGRAEAFWERGIKSWDIAAGLLIVKESGGFVCDLDDDRKNPLDTGAILASNEPLYADLKKVLRKI